MMTRLPISVLLLAAVFIVAAPSAAHAYVGPGAGFAFVSSIFIINLYHVSGHPDPVDLVDSVDGSAYPQQSSPRRGAGS